jgi:hypothetical protein
MNSLSLSLLKNAIKRDGSEQVNFRQDTYKQKNLYAERNDHINSCEERIEQKTILLSFSFLFSFSSFFSARLDIRIVDCSHELFPVSLSDTKHHHSIFNSSAIQMVQYHMLGHRQRSRIIDRRNLGGLLLCVYVCVCVFQLT